MYSLYILYYLLGYILLKSRKLLELVRPPSLLRKIHSNTHNLSPPGSRFSASPQRASSAAPSMVVASTEIILIYQHLSCTEHHSWGQWCDVIDVIWWHLPVTHSSLHSSARAISAIVPCFPITATKAALARTRMFRSCAQSQTQSIFMVGRNLRLQFSTRSLVLGVIQHYKFQEFFDVSEVCPDIPAQPFLGGFTILDIKKICWFCLFRRREFFP